MAFQRPLHSRVYTEFEIQTLCSQKIHPRIKEKIDVEKFALKICNYFVLYPLWRLKGHLFPGGHTYIFVPPELPN